MADAVWEARAVEIDYGRSDQIVTREIEPLGLVLKAGVWYVVARTDGQFRTYRVSRIRGAEPLDRRFERPHGFDLAAYWAESSAAYEREAPRAEVVIRIRPERMGWLSEAVGRRAADEAERLEMLDPEGWVHLRLHVEWPDEVAHAMLRLGSGVEVLEPLEVREQVVATASASSTDMARPRSGGDRGRRWARLSDQVSAPAGSPAAR